MRAVALLSGGLDSTVATWAASREYEIALALTFDYGQRAAARECQAALAICAQLGCPHHLVKLQWLGKLGHSALTDLSQSLPEPEIELMGEAALSEQTSQAVWGPNRNGVFVNIAAAFCEALDCQLVVVGFNTEEAAQFPDNSAAFLAATNRALELSTQTRVEVISPTINLTKCEIVELGMRLGAPLAAIWSCYDGGQEHCMRCESCLRLRKALNVAGLWDEWQRRRDDTADGVMP